MTILASEPTRVLVADDELVVAHLRITDPDAVAFVAASDEPELTLVRCVEMGARVLRLANATVDTQVVEHRFDQMTQSLDRSVDELARRIDESAKALLDGEDGDLTTALREWLTDVTETLGATFDENSKKSAIAKLEKLLESARAEQVAAVRRLLDPDSDDSPLNRWRVEIVSEVRDRGEALERLVNDLSFRLGLDQGEAAALDRTAVKGFDFEDVVYATLESIAALRPGSSGDPRPRDPAPRQSNFRNSSRLTPDALMIAFSVPVARSRACIGTTTRCRWSGCRNTWWLPRTRSSCQPQLSSARTAFRGVTAGNRGIRPRR